MFLKVVEYSQSISSHQKYELQQILFLIYYFVINHHMCDYSLPIVRNIILGRRMENTIVLTLFKNTLVLALFNNTFFFLLGTFVLLIFKVDFACALKLNNGKSPIVAIAG